jgi:hypothetical protein
MSKDTHAARSIDPEPSKAHVHDDDVIVVPKGSSRTRFLMTSILVLMVLTTFTVSREVVDVLTGQGNAKNAYMRWKRPDGTVEAMKQMDFLLVRQNVSRVESILSGGRSSKEKEDTAIARHIIVDRLAKDAGVEVPDSEVRDILKGFGTPDVYRQTLEHYRTTTSEFEETLRSLLRVARYEQLLGAAAAIPDPSTILESWKKSHKEYQLDTVEVATDAYAEEAKAACPSGDELKAWFEALPDPEKSAYRTQIEAKTSAEFAWFVLDPPTSTERLLAKYPRPSTENAEDVAKNWYETNKDLLFRKPNLPPGKAPTPEDYEPFDTVKEKAREQGLAYQSMLDWVNDMKAHEAKGEPVILATEAMALGFAYRREDNVHTRAEWKTVSPPWGGPSVIAAFFSPTSQPDKLLPEVIVDAKGIFAGRLLKKEDSRMPAFEEFQDKVQEGWIKKKKGELALAKLEALRAKFPATPGAADPAAGTPDPSTDPANAPVVETDGEKFKAAAKELGLEVKTGDWFDAGAGMRNGLPTPVALYERQAAQIYGATPGAIAKPSLSADKSNGWIVRIAGSREPDASKLTPQDYETARQFAVYESRSELFQKTFGSDDYLKQHFGLELESWRRSDSKTPKPQP